MNIISIARLADTFDDDEGTTIHTKRYYSDFQFNKRRFQKTIFHADRKIPDVEVLPKVDSWKAFYSFTSCFQQPICYMTTTSSPTAIMDEPALVSDDEASDEESLDEESLSPPPLTTPDKTLRSADICDSDAESMEE